MPRLLSGCLAGLLLIAGNGPAQVIKTIAGTSQGLPAQSLPALQAPIGVPGGLAVDSNGNVLIADNTLRLVYRRSADGTLSVIAGNGILGSSGDGGPAIAAALAGPSGLALDASGNLFIADQPAVPYPPFDRVRDVAASGTIASIDCQCAPSDVAVDGSGTVYIATTAPNMIFKVTPGGAVTSLASIFQRNFSTLPPTPQGIAVYGGNIYFSIGATDQAFVANRVFKITPDGNITYIAGNGLTKATGDGSPALIANIGNPGGLAFDTAGNLYITDMANHLVRKIDASGVISTVAGNGTAGFSGDGGRATLASLNLPSRVAVDKQGSLYIGDANNFRVRKVTFPDDTITTIAGVGFHNYFGDGGRATLAGFNQPRGVVYDSTGALYIADTANHVVRKMQSDGTVRTVAGTGAAATSGTCTGSAATNVPLGTPAGLAADNSGNLYIADIALNVVCKLSPSGAIQNVAGNGKAGFGGDGGAPVSAMLSQPSAVVVDKSGTIYIADTGNNRIRRVTATQISTIAGTGSTRFSGDGGALTATLNAPMGLAMDSAGNLYISDTGNQRVREISNGLISTILGDGIPAFSGDGGAAVNAEVNQPTGLTVDPAGNVFVSDTLNNRVRRIATNGAITTVVGNGSPGYGGDLGLAVTAQLTRPNSLAADGAGNVVIADTGNNQIRELLIGVSISYQATLGALTFSQVSGGAPPPPQTFSLTSTVSGLPFLLLSDSPWLTLSSTSGLIPSSLQATVDAATLSPGVYTGTITANVPAASPTNQSVPVQFTVLPPLPAQLSVNTQNLSFTAIQGTPAQTARILISDTGGAPLSFAAIASTDTGANWLSLGQGSGRATPSAPFSLVVNATPGALAPGTYQGTVVISGAGAVATVRVSLSVAPSKPILLLSQSGLSFTAVEKGGAPLPQTFGILNTGTGIMNWSASASTLSGGSGWLQISPTSGLVNTPFLDVNSVKATIDPTNMTAGTYYGRIQVTSQAANSPQLITIVLTVLPVGTNPGIQIRPTGLVFTGIAGTIPSSQDVQVNSVAALSDIFVTGTTNQKGFTYLPTSAPLAPNQPATVSVYPDFSALRAGEIDRAAITLLRQSDGSSQNISVLIVVAPPASASERLGLAPSAGACTSNNLEIQWRSPLQNFTAVVGQPVTLEAQVIDDCGNLVGPNGVANAAVNASFSNKDADVRLVHIGNGVWSGTWRPVNSVQGQVNVSVTAFNSGSVLQSGQRSLTGTLSAVGNTPTVTSGGVVHAASDAAGAPIAPGSLVTIYGSNLANAQGQSSVLPLPQQQNGAQVLLGNLPLPILYTSSGQINVQVPFGTPVNTQYQITVQRDNVLSVPEQLVITPAEPGVFTVNQQGTGQGVIFKSDGVTLAQPATPATVGETVVIYCTGLGLVDPPVAEGAPAPSSPLSHTVNPVTVTMGGQNAAVAFSGLTPGFPGLYQVNAIVPAGVSGDAVPVVLAVAGQSSPPVTLSVK